MSGKKRMNSFFYLVYLSCHNVFSNKKLLLVVILSYFFGLLMPFYCLANIEVFISCMGTINVIDSGNTYTADLQTLYGKEGADIENSLSSLGLADYLVTTYFQGNMQAGEISTKVSVTGTGEDWADFERFEMIEGSFSLREAADAPEGEAECVVAQGLAKKYGLHPGSQIMLNGVSYRIAGIVNNFNYYNHIFISRAMVPVTADIMWHRLYLRYGEPTDAGRVENRLQKVFPDRSIRSVRRASDDTAQTFREGVSRSAAILLVGAVSLVIAVLNIFLMVSGKYEEDKKTIAVKLALGAARSDIGTELFFENVVFVCMANLLMWVTRPLLTGLVPVSADFSFSWRIYPLILGLSVTTAAVMSVFLRNKAVKVSLAALLKGE